MGATKQDGIGNMQKGSYIVLEGAACKVVSVDVSKPGKHGHSKIRLAGIGLIDGKKRIIVAPGHDNVEVPIIEKKSAQVLSVKDNKANVMETTSYETFDLEIPEELKGQVVAGCSVLYWEILDQRVMKQIKSE